MKIPSRNNPHKNKNLLSSRGLALKAFAKAGLAPLLGAECYCLIGKREKQSECFGI